MWLLHLLMIQVLAVVTCQCDKDATDIFFATNLDEMYNSPLTFDRPLPSWLKGTLIRNGVGRLEFEHRKMVHLFDGYGKLASWRFPGDGTAYFTTKMIYSKSYNESLTINDIAPYLLLDVTDPKFNVFQDIDAFQRGADNMNINIFNYGEGNLEFVVVNDYWDIYRIDPFTLNTIELIKTDTPDHPSTSPVILSSAHALPEYGTQNMLTYVSMISVIPDAGGVVQVMRIKSASEREHIATIEMDKVSYMHSFAVTENYMVLIATPFYVTPDKMLKSFSPMDAFEWVKSDVTKLHVVNIKTGVVRTFETETMFFMHIANAYESTLTSHKIMIDVCTYKDVNSLRNMELPKLFNPTDRANAEIGVLKRYTIDLDHGDVNVYVFNSQPQFVNTLDYPTINENFRSQNYCNVYGIAYKYDQKDWLHMALVKKDVCNATNDKVFLDPELYLNEAFFVPRPGGSTEDDGVLMLPVLNVTSRTTNFTIIDAKTLTVISSARLPTNIPFGTHGRFFDYIL